MGPLLLVKASLKYYKLFCHTIYFSYLKTLKNYFKFTQLCVSIEGNKNDLQNILVKLDFQKLIKTQILKTAFATVT